MPDQEPAPRPEARQPSPPTGGTGEVPDLPPEYFRALLNAPACKSKGYCDNCGRCER